MGRGRGWIVDRVRLQPLLPCPYMAVAELEDARPRPKFTSFSPVLKRHQQTRVQDVFFWLPGVVPGDDKINNVIEQMLLFENDKLVSRSAHTAPKLCRRCAGFPSKYAIGFQVLHRSCPQMHRDMQPRSMRESVKYCLCALQLSGSNVQSAILAPLSRKFAGRAEIIKTGLRGCAFPPSLA